MADRIKNYQQEADQISTLKEIRTDLGVTPSSYTPDATVVTKDRVVTFAQAEEELVVLSDIEKGVKQQVTEVDIAQKDIANIKALLQGHLYDYQTDSDSAYIKSVPAGAMPYAALEKLGGKTVRIVNLVSNGNFSNSYAGWDKSGGADYSFSNNVMTLYCPGNNIGEGAHTNTGAGFRLVQGHKYYATAECRVTTENLSVSINVFGSRNGALDGGTPTTVGSAWVRVGRIATAGAYTSNAGYVVMFGTAEVTACKYQIRNVMLIDLTETYGAGNEPTSATHLDTVFTEFFLNQLASQKVTSVVSKDSSDNTLQTYSIPAEVQALEGYGWSAGSVYNYIDYERKVFVQRVGRADLGDRTWWGGEKYNNITYFYCGIGNFNPRAKGDTNGLVCNKYPVGYVDKRVNFYGINWGNQFNVFDNDYEGYTTAQFKAAMSGVIVYYELDTPIETDISEYLTDDNLINVEAGGTLTFPNSNGDDYRLPVPSEETYMIDLQASLGG